MSMNGSLKLAIITGAAHRMGRHFALSLAKQGYAIGLHYHRSEIQAMKTAAEIQSFGTQVFTLKADLRDPNEIKRLWELVDHIPHQVEILINSAAIMKKGDISSLSPLEFDETISLNLRAPMLCSQEASKRMSDGGLIINISDVGARLNWMRYPGYSISKAGLEVLTRILAKSLAPKIRVNAIAPGLVLLPEDENSVPWEKLINKVPMKRIASPEEITSIIELLVKNKYITGQVIDVDGGYSL